MAGEIYFVLTDQIRSSLESYSDASVLDNVKNTELGDVIEYRYISQAFHERKKYGTICIHVESVTKLGHASPPGFCMLCP